MTEATEMMIRTATDDPDKAQLILSALSKIQRLIPASVRIFAIGNWRKGATKVHYEKPTYIDRMFVDLGHAKPQGGQYLIDLQLDGWEQGEWK